MKRSKFEERTLRPIFPRLHVNDTERGGPRAPPRNKMALYEQLTVPSSNRCKPASVHVSPNSCSNLVPTASSSKAPPFPSHAADRIQRHAYDVANSKYPTSLVEQRRKPQDEDDFAVPIFCRPGKDQSDDLKQGRAGSHNEKRCWAFNSCYPVRLPNDCNEHQKEVNSGCPRLMRDREAKDKGFTTAFVPRSDPAIKRTVEVLAQESPEGPSQLQEDALMNFQSDANKTSRLKYSNADSRCSDTSLRSLKEEKGRIPSGQKSNSLSGLSNRNEFDSEVEENQRVQALRREMMDRHDHASQTSTVATISGSDISPDDVVGILGLKRFWKARKAIVNQQRLFAVQVFELHRLIKVQKLIAESPEILLEPSTFVGQKVTPLKKHPSSCALLKAAVESDRRKGNSQKPDDNTEMEVIAENTVVEAPASQPEPLSHYPFAVNPALGSQTAQSPEPPPFIGTDSKVGPMPFLLPGGSQWLVPVMSPSEGLIFKPYPGPGYGAAPSPYYHQQGIPFNPQAYFPPYGMQTMNSLSTSVSAVDQTNRLSGSNCDGRMSRMPNSSLPQQGSCSTKSRKQSEVFGSTCSSSPSKGGRDTVGTGLKTKEKEGLTPFPSTPMAGVPERAHTLVKVVPHNARTATESAARIFRLIQEERRQHQSE